jgi:signal peptidase I
MQYSNHFIKRCIGVIGIIVLVFVIRTIGFGLYQVPSGSMETTMLVGERFFADKLSYWVRAPRMGEVISFNDPSFMFSSSQLPHLFQQYVWGPVNIAKRIIAGPGDTIKGIIENGVPTLLVNHQKLEEPYINSYPLIQVWQNDPVTMRSLINTMRKQMKNEIITTGAYTNDVQINEFNLDLALIHAARQRVMAEYATFKSYDPGKSYANQPFYALNKDYVILDERSNSVVLYPHVPRISPEEHIPSMNRYWNGSDEFYVTLDSDEYWVMGDNRQNSKDSRYFGPIKRDQIHGRIIWRIWSVDSTESWWIFDALKHPIDFCKRIRWSRVFQAIC